MCPRLGEDILFSVLAGASQALDSSQRAKWRLQYAVSIMIASKRCELAVTLRAQH